MSAPVKLPEAAHSAFVYAEGMGWHVFPVQPGGKRPFGKLAHQGFRSATTDVEVIVGWWTSVPRANVGIRTGAESGLLVVDVDGPEGYATLARWESEHGPLPDTLTVDTPRGEHRYFRHPGVEVRSSEVGPKLDVKADGGCVTAPPSTRADGGYVWRCDPWLNRDRLADLPSAWVERLRVRPRPAPRAFVAPLPRQGHRPEYVRKALREELLAVATATEGTRNATLFRSAAALGRFVVSGEVDEVALRDELVRAAEASGLPQREAQAAISSAFRAAAA